MGKIIKTPYINFDIDIITVDDMPNQTFKEIYELCGKEVAISLLQNYAGCQIQVPARAFYNLRQRLLKSEFDGTTESIRYLARKYGFTEYRVREALKAAKVDVPAEGQLELFKVQNNTQLHSK